MPHWTRTSLKKWVFKRALKVERQSDVLMSLGKVFHKVAAATANELSPALTWVRRTVNMLLLVERRALVGLYGHTRSHKYFGASPCTALYVNTNSLKSILCATGNQWRMHNRGMALSLRDHHSMLYITHGKTVKKCYFVFYITEGK